MHKYTAGRSGGCESLAAQAMRPDLVYYQARGRGRCGGRGSGRWACGRRLTL